MVRERAPLPERPAEAAEADADRAGDTTMHRVVEWSVALPGVGE